ncbi:MAG: recombinase family protein [Actinobacteria bacterium]|nr:recombinase family protein [Actinomycetota bacterium]
MGPRKVVGYVRVSTEEQSESGLGLEAQRTSIRGECHRRGWHLEHLFEDKAASGKAVTGRTGLSAALAAVETGGVADGLVVAKLDRLSRSLLDFAQLMERARAKGWALIALDLGVDTTTPSGEMLANVLAVFAQFERRLIGQRTRDALAVRRLQGAVLGRPVSLSVELDARINGMRSQGASLRQIAENLNSERVPTAQGGRRWHASTVRAVLGRLTSRRAA